MSLATVRALFLACCTAIAVPTHAYQLAPVGTKHEVADSNVSTSRIAAQAKWLQYNGVELFTDPVHETLTQLIYSCDFDWSQCADANLELAGPYVIAGVRWNDDPGFLLKAGEGNGSGCKTADSITFMRQTRCWGSLFKDAESRAVTSPEDFQGPNRKSNLMTRSHFGDLQFLHAMASRDDVPAAQTKEKVMMWARFTWGVALGEYTLETDLGKIQIDGWSEHFVSGPNVQDLLTIGRSSTRPQIKDVAFGSLLHVLQDSLSESHVRRREPIASARCGPNNAYRQLGRIQEFSSYARQDHKLHGSYDSVDRARQQRSADPDVVDAGKVLLDMYRQKAAWTEVSQYLSECVFALDDGAQASGPGVAAR